MGFTASVAADHSSHRLADTVKGGELSYMTLALQRKQTAYIAMDAVKGGPGRPQVDASSSGTWMHRHGLHC